MEISAVLGVDIKELLYGAEPKDRGELTRLIIGAVITMAVSIAVLILNGILGEMNDIRFFFAPLRLLQLFGFPCMYLLWGWLIMQAAGVVLGARQLKFSWIRWLKRGLLILMATYFIILLPLAFSLILSIPEFLSRRESISWYYKFLPVWDDIAVWLLIYSRYIRPFFLLIGVGLWISGFPPKKRLNADSEEEAPA